MAASERTARQLLELSLVNTLASDAHGPHIRELPKPATTTYWPGT